MDKKEGELNTSCHIVGVGASAGGLEALSEFVASLTPGLGCIYVVAQHMSPKHRSLMAEILGRETRLLVKEITDRETAQPDVIYIIPPGKNGIVRSGQFHLTTPPPEVSPKPSVNMLFESMAEEFAERAVGIVLSGTGSDGTRGLRDIKSAGGITFVQIPETAKYDGMPRSAIDALVADRILAPDQMGQELERVINLPGALPEFGSWEQRPAELADLFERVRLRTKIDFSSYKLSTVQRRLQRRMIATETGTLSSYLAFTEQHPVELDALAKETLISVTEFFRDKDSFKTLERYVADLVSAKKVNDEIRVWSVACATGEEAYSLAIVLMEAIAHSSTKPQLQIFATDIDNDALVVARRGIYNATAMAEMPQEYIARYFQPSGNGFEPTKELRDCVTFARQDVAVDPPFLRQDLVVCRNVLIYFNTDLQAKVLSSLRYALRDDGLLFLGRSETVTQQEALFASADRRARIYRPRGKGLPVTQRAPVRGKLNSPSTSNRPNERGFERLFFKSVADRFAPAMLVDSTLRILHSHSSVARFMTFPSGSPEMNLAQLIVTEFSSEVLTTLHRARRGNKSAYSRKRRVASMANQTWRLAIHPLGEHWDTDTFLVVFESTVVTDPAARAEDAQNHAANEMEVSDELASTREHLQTLIEEMAASNEEMQALGEELQAGNEELQATNEELEAANEEMQATNEELLSVNQESQIKTVELAAINAEFESVYNTLEFPVLLFDPDLCLRRANGAAIRLFDLQSSFGGQALGHLRLPAYLDRIDKHLSLALTDMRKETFPVEDAGRSYQVYVKPTVSIMGVCQSVVLVVIDNTDLVLAQARIRESQERLLSIMNQSVLQVSVKDTAGRYEFVNKRFCDHFGVVQEEVLGKTDHQIFEAVFAKKMRSLDLDVMGKMEPVESIDSIKVNSQMSWLQTVRFPIFDSNGAVTSICAQSSDITQSHAAEEQRRLAATVFESAGEGILVTDSNAKILTVNRAFQEITGYHLQDVVGKNPSMLRSSKHSDEFFDVMWQSLLTKGAWQGEIFNQRKSGEVYPEWLTISAVKDESGATMSYVSIFSDITVIKSSQQRIEYLATHDELTGIPNRSLLMDRLSHHIAQGRRQKSKLAVLFIDLDNFKSINDNLGHDVGDLLLKEATERLQKCLRESDTLARLGGDEFVVVLYDIELAVVNMIASRIVDFLAASFNIESHTMFVSASVGISVFPENGDDSVTLLKDADTAMYRAKDRGRNQFQFFTDEMKVIALQRMALESGIRVALDSGYLHMVYQPQVSLENGAIVGAEALVRWSDPHMGEVPPSKFIPIAEDCGLIGKVGEAVFKMVLRDIANWKALRLTPPPIAINMSAHQLRDQSIVEKISQWLLDSGVAPKEICLEITESALMDQLEVVSGILRQFEVMGFTISLDDFGTGYSSLSYLRKLPIHELKVDRSFVDGIGTSGDDRSITQAVVNMAHALGQKVVAEGVETKEQLDILKSLKCEIAQGYLFYKPMPATSFKEILNRHPI